MKTTINQRIENIVSNLGYKSRRSFAEKIGISQTTFNDIIKGSEPKHSTLEKILNAEPSISARWLLTGKGEMYKSEKPILFDEKINGSIPFYADLPVSAGEMGLSENRLNEKPTGYMYIPNVSAEELFPVIGCSMLPKIKAGDLIGVNRVNRWEKVEPDKIYMIVTNEERMLKRLRIDNDNNDILWCVSDNYHEFKIYKCDIRFIYHVVFHGELM